ncbi:MAG: ATP-dependent Clp protease proteolytic subunit [Nitrosopumilus sp.]
MEYKGTTLEFVKNLNESEKVANMLLFGQIGTSKDGDTSSFVNGDSFGKEMVFLSEIGFKTIKLGINSVGGSIRQGMSIINAMNIARMNGVSIETNIVGVADSMAGMISAFGDKGKRTVANFGSGIVHEPLVENEKGELVKIEELPDGELKSELLSMKDTLITLMVSSTGNDRSTIQTTMKEGKRLNAREMKSFGMVDTVLSLSNKPLQIEVENATAIELMVACSQIEKVSINKTNKMKKVNEILNLGADTAEGSTVKAIETLQNTVKDQDQSILDKDAEILKLNGEKEVLVNSAKETADKNAESYVDSLINAGKLKKENRDALVNSAKNDFNGFKTLTESLEVTFVDVTKEIKTSGQKTDKNEELAKEFFNLRQDADAYENMKKDNNAKFLKMEDAYLNSNTDFDSVQ